MPPRFGFVDAFALPSNGFLKEGKEPKATKPCITRLREEEEEEDEEDEEEEDGFDGFLLRAAGSE
jgi:ribosomal protein L12E/L44/L45/RPP1/RPP2